jgi:hypothetical protein
MHSLRYLLLLTAVSLVPSLSRAADDPPKQDKAAPATADLKKAIQDEINAFNKKNTEWQTEMRQAQRNDPSKPINMASRPSAAPYANKILELVAKQSDDPAAIDGLAWVINMVPSGEQNKQAAEYLMKHINNDAAAPTVQRLAQRGDLSFPSSVSGTKLADDHPIRKLVNAAQESKSDKVRGMAYYGLGTGIFQHASTVKRNATVDISQIKERMEKSIEDLEKRIANADDEQKKSLEQQKKRTEANLTSVVEAAKKRKADAEKEMANAATWNKDAEELFKKALPILEKADPKSALRCKGALNDLGGKLDPGVVAMEIAAEDVDGKNFKLSDYRGKVILLDFWGHW